MPTALKLTFGSGQHALEVPVILSTGSTESVMNVEFFEKIKESEDAEEIIRSEGKSEFDGWRSAGFTTNEIFGAASLHAVLNGVPVVIRFHLVKDLIVDAVLGTDFLTSLCFCTMAYNYLEWRHGTKIVRANFLDNFKFKNQKEGEKVYFVCGIQAYVRLF